MRGEGLWVTGPILLDDRRCAVMPPSSSPLLPGPPPSDPTETGAARSVLPVSAVPETRRVPLFAPLRVPGGAPRLRRAWWRRRHGLTAGLALAAAAIAATSARGEEGGAKDTAVSPARHKPRAAVEMVSAPIRIADGETVRLLRPGDRVDVIAAPAPALSGGALPDAEVVASGVRVAEVPRAVDQAQGDGALVVVSVPRALAAELAGAGARSRLAVTVC